MPSNIRFGSWEGATLIINLLTFKLLMSAIRVFTETAGTAGWLMAVYVCVIVLLAVNLMLVMIKRFPGKDILDITSEALGKTMEKIIGVMIVVLLSFNVIAMLKVVSESNKIVAFPQTPVDLIEFFYIAVAIQAAYAGFEAIVRNHGFAIPIVLLAYLLIFAFGASLSEADNFLPILGTGTDKIFLEGFFGISVFNELIVFLLIVPFLGDNKVARKTVHWGSGISCLLLIGSVAYYTSVVEYPVLNEILIPIYQITRLSGLNRFFQRFEAVFLITWVFTMLLYVSAHLYLICHTLAKAFRLTNQKMLILPVAATLYFATETNQYHVGDTSVNVIYYRYVWIAALAVPLVIMAVALLKRKWKGREKKREVV